MSSHSQSVTHVVSENNYGDEVRNWLGSQLTAQDQKPVHLLDISWYTESMRAGHPVEILQRHRLKVHFALNNYYVTIPLSLRAIYIIE